MTKTNTALLEKLSTTPKGVKKWDKEQLEFITAMLETATTSRAVANPPIYENGTDEAPTQLWCNRHLRYEPTEDFKYYEDKDKYHQACIAAVETWNDYGKQIQKLVKLNSAKATEGGDALKEHIMTIESLKIERAGSYPVPEAV